MLQDQFWPFCGCKTIFDGRGSVHLGPAVGLKTLSIHVCVCVM